MPDRLNRRAGVLLAWTAAGTAVALTAAGLVLQIRTAATPVPLDFGSRGASAVTALLFVVLPVLGALIAGRRPQTRLAWMFLAIGMTMAIWVFADGYAVYGLLARPGSLAAPRVAAWFANWIWIPGWTLTGLMFLLFPDGRLPSRRWRPPAWMFLAMGAAFSLGSMFSAGPIANYTFADNPFGVVHTDVATVKLAGTLTLLALGLVAIVSLVPRARKARGDQRLQYLWVGYGSAVVVVVTALGWTLFAVGLHNSVIEDLTQSVAVLLPIAAAIAVLRYRLFDIELVINKTLVYGVLAGFVTIVYAALVAGAGQAFGTGGRPNLALSIAATALVALTFGPARERAQELANLLVYGRRASPYEVLTDFSHRMGELPSSAEVLARMAQLLGEATGALRTEVWLRVGERLRAAASWPDGDWVAEPVTLHGEELRLPTNPDLALPVLHHGELLGALALKTKPGEAIRPVEMTLASDLASQAGHVLRNLRLTEELVGRLEDLRASRERLVSAQDDERRRLERDLHDGAQQYLVALKVQLRLAAQALEREPAEVRSLLDELAELAGEALASLRDLAHGIYPPLLADRGLAAAVISHTDRSPLPVNVAAEGLGRYPKEAEAAVYFCCLEALQNVAKYSQPSQVDVLLSQEGEELCFRVDDNGQGFDPTVVKRGAGLQNMADRLEALGGSLEIHSNPGQGTQVTGRIPLGSRPPANGRVLARGGASPTPAGASPTADYAWHHPFARFLSEGGFAIRQGGRKAGGTMRPMIGMSVDNGRSGARRRGRWFLTLLAALVLTTVPGLVGLTAVPAGAASVCTGPEPPDFCFDPPPTPVFSPPAGGFAWSVPQRFTDTVASYHWDEASATYDPAYVRPASWPATFYGCATAADDAAGPGRPTANTYTWFIAGQTISRQSCRLHYDFPDQGTYPVELTVTGPNAAGPFPQSVTIRDILIVTLGDSYASGEGNPDVPRSGDQPAQWVDRRCHRSAAAGSARAAAALEAADPHTSVTFLSFACSGGTIGRYYYRSPDPFDFYAEDHSQPLGVGVLAPYRGSEPDDPTDYNEANFLPSQVDQMVGAITCAQTDPGCSHGPRRIDALTMSAGGNDLGFGPLAASCVFHADCTGNATVSSPGNGPQELLTTRFAQDAALMPGYYSRLAQALDGTGLQVAKTYITEYPDPTSTDDPHDSDGLCDSMLGDIQFPAVMNDVEVRWAAGTVLPTLNNDVANAARAHGWTYVDGISSAFGGHGYCASDGARWIRRASESTVLQGPDDAGKTTGTLHPTAEGQMVYRDRLLDRLRPDVAALPVDTGPPPAADKAIVDVAGCGSNTLPANDDGSTGSVPIGFPVQLGRQGDGTPSIYGRLFVNNNGNVTFDSALGTYTPFTISGATTKIIAPLFADVDTRGPASGVVSYGYGSTVFQGRPAFCVDWVNVGYYNAHTDKLNSSQLLLVDRSDTGAGNFDVVMNFDKVQWEAGDASGGNNGLGGSSARMGYSDGGGTSFELPGSGVNGALLDSNPSGLAHRSLNSLQPGRYVFPIRGGAIPTGRAITGRVIASSDSSSVGNALVAACGAAGFCHSTLAAADGSYSVAGLDPDSYSIRAFPPSTSALFPGQRAGVVLAGTDLASVDITLDGPAPLPNGTTITNRYVDPAGVPVVYWQEPLSLATHACPGGTAGYQVLQGTAVVADGPMMEGPAGTYITTIPQLSPHHGEARVVITVSCQAGPITFDVYIDPSGVVTTTDHTTPVAGATVTLYHADSQSGPFTPVPAGDAVMSPSNRADPDTTDLAGHFGWDVFPGFYKVRAQKADCHAPGDPAQPFVESAVLTIPPAVTDLHLELDCRPPNTPPAVVVPADMTVEGNTGGGATVTFTATATDEQEGPLTPTCTPPSGSLFSLGSTDVTCSATDHGPGTALTATALFTVTVRDTTAPTLTCPAAVNQRVGSAVSLGSVSAADVVDAHPEVTNDAPARYGPGTTSVTWKALDASGNSATCSQTVTLTYGFGGFFPPVADGMSANAGRAIPVKWTLTDAGDNVVADPAVVVAASFNAPGGTYALSRDGSQYVLVAKTSHDWRGVKTFTLRLNDGTEHSFKVNFG